MLIEFLELLGLFNIYGMAHISLVGISPNTPVSKVHTLYCRDPAKKNPCPRKKESISENSGWFLYTGDNSTSVIIIDSFERSFVAPSMHSVLPPYIDKSLVFFPYIGQAKRAFLLQ